MHGIIRQLVKASVSGESPDEVNLSFMMSMRCAHHLAQADDLARHDSAARAYTAGLGFFKTGGLAEIFINVPGRSGSAIEAVARDAAILTSICLQYGASAATIRHALTRNSDGSAGGPLGVVLDLLAPASDRPTD
jgi:hypothetical protein